eukprot:Sdes_comp20643_c0_seq1m15852
MTGLMFNKPEDHIGFIENCLEKVKSMKEEPSKLRWDIFVERKSKSLPPIEKKHKSEKKKESQPEPVQKVEQDSSPTENPIEYHETKKPATPSAQQKPPVQPDPSTSTIPPAPATSSPNSTFVADPDSSLMDRKIVFVLGKQKNKPCSFCCVFFTNQLVVLISSHHSIYRRARIRKGNPVR